MRFPFFQVDAFTNPDSQFSGNPAAVCLLSAWLDDALLQQIAGENNLSETAFLIKVSSGCYQLRWFTPATEVDLCGHATLASALVLYECCNANVPSLTFQTRSGILTVTPERQFYCMDFPATRLNPVVPTSELLVAMGLEESDISGVYQADDIVIVVHDESLLDGLAPDFGLLGKIKTRGVVVTAAAARTDFRSRWFGPGVGVNEDPVTGSAHTYLAPFWSERINKRTLTAEQGGNRRGKVTCRVTESGRVELRGTGQLIIAGEFILTII